MFQKYCGCDNSCKCCKCCNYCCKRRKKCPQQLTPCEGAQCQVIRSQIAAQNFDIESGLIYTYVIENVKFKTTVKQCEGLEFGYRLATVNEINQLAHLFTYFDNDGNVKKCPTLVWSTENGYPVIVRIQPCKGKKIKVIRKFDIENVKFKESV